VASLGWTSRYVFGSSSLLALLVAWHSVVFAAQLTLTWTDDSTDAQGISIERSSDTAGAYTQIAITAAGVTSYTDPTVAAGVRYCYRLRAFNASGYSAYSNAACAIPGSTVGLAVIKVGEGDGTVTSAPEGIDCGAICSASYSGGTAVAVTAAATPGSVFTGWTGGGCDGGAEVTCVATLMVSTVVTATFDRAVALVVSTTGAGRGHVTSEPAGIDCGGTCSASYASGTQVTLTATPDAGSAFTGWNDGDCSGTGTCIVAPTAAICAAGIPPMHQAELILHGRRLSAREAFDRGLLHELALDVDTLERRACERARELRALAPAAYRVSKRALRAPVLAAARATATAIAEDLPRENPFRRG